MEDGHAGGKSYQKEVGPEEDGEDDRSLLAEGGEDGGPFCGDHVDA
jgi:hypothetical protein